MPAESCPVHELLKAYLRGTLPQNEAADVARHLGECPDCDALVDTLEAESDSLIEQLRKPASPDRYSQEPECREAVSQAADANESSATHESTDTTSMVSVGEETDLGKLGDYELLEELDHGGMGTVFRAMHVKLGREVALKVLPKGRMTDERAVARFEREMMAIGRLDHPNIVRATDAGEAEGVQFLAMELLEGYDLGQLVDLCGPMRVADACNLIANAAMGLQCAHEHGLVHRDIKPSNVMLTVDGEVKVLDLGLARFQFDQPAAGREITAVGQPMGTADYMAPEQVRDTHSVDIRADIYSLGCTFYKLLSGQPPFGGEKYQSSIDKMMAHRKEAAPPISIFRTDLPKQVARILEQMLDKEPEKRFLEPVQLAEALAPFSVGSDLLALMLAADDARQAIQAEEEAAAAAEPDKDEDATGDFDLDEASASRGTGSKITASGSRGSGTGSGSRGSGTGTGSGTGSRSGVGAGSWRRATASKTLTGVQPAIGQFIEMDRARRRRKMILIASIVIVALIVIVLLFGYAAWVTRSGQSDSGMIPSQGGTTYLVPTDIPEAATRPKPALVEIPLQAPEELAPGDPFSQTALVAAPATVDGCLSWTIETLGHRDPIEAVASSPDGKRLATGTADGVIRFWNAADGSFAGLLVAYDGRVSALSWSPGGRYLAAGYSSETLRIWDVTDRRLVRVVYDLSARSLGPGSLAWSPDGQLLAYVSPNSQDEQFDEIHLWQASTGDVLFVLNEHESAIAALAFSPDGKFLASGEGKRIRFWNPASGESVKDLDISRYHSEPVSALAWSPSATMIASSCAAPTGDHAVAFWNVDTGDSLGTLPGHPCGDQSLLWTADGKTLVTAGAFADQRVRFWDFTAEDFNPLRLDSATGLLAAAEQATFAVLLEGAEVRVFDAQLKDEVRQLPLHPGTPGGMAFSPDCKRLASGYGDGLVHLWDVEARGPTGRLEVQGRAGFSTWAPDGKTLGVMVAPQSLSSNGNDAHAAIFDVETGDSRYQLRTRGRGHIDRIAWSPDGKSIAGTGDEWRIWEARNGKPASENIPAASALDWSPDSTALAVGWESGITVYDVGSSGELHDVTASAPRAIAYSGDGKLLAATDGEDHTDILVWNLDSPDEPLHALKGRHRSSIAALGWRDDKTLVSGSVSEVCLWDIEKGNLKARQSIPVTALSRDTRTVAAAGPSTVLLHRVDDGRLLGTLLYLNDGQHVMFSPQGHWRGSPQAEAELVYVVQTETGQQVLTPAEFADKFNWTNDTNLPEPKNE